MKKLSLLQKANIAMMLISGVALVGFQYKPFGWILLALSAATLALSPKKFTRDLLLIHLSIAILGIAEINTSITYPHMVKTGLLLSLAVVVPYYISHKIFGDNKIQFPLGDIRNWSKKQFAYLGLAAFLGYLLIPFYLNNTQAYINWPSDNDFSGLARLFIGTNGLGIWDELFFVVVVLGLLRNHLRFLWANIAQAILWTAFLYELGFTGWGPYMIFIFALLQGYIFKRTHSLLYIIAIHLTVDLILFLALVNAHNPEYFNIFIT